jgi:hypothetical protein
MPPTLRVFVDTFNYWLAKFGHFAVVAIPLLCVIVLASMFSWIPGTLGSFIVSCSSDIFVYFWNNIFVPCWNSIFFLINLTARIVVEIAFIAEDIFTVLGRLFPFCLFVVVVVVLLIKRSRTKVALECLHCARKAFCARIAKNK